MSKIVRAVNAMISNPDKITDIIPSKIEYFFVYDNKHKWSIVHYENDDIYQLFYYPGDKDIRTLANEEGNECIEYQTSDIKTRESYESFKDLYTLIQEKLYGVDKALEEIIASSGKDVF